MRRRLLEDSSLWAVGAFVAVIAVIPFFVPHYTSLVLVIGIHSMLTVGLCLLMGYTGQVSLGHAAFYGIGAFFSAILSTNYGVNPWLAMLIAALATGGIAYVVAFPIFRLRGNYLAMGTLGFGLVIWWSLLNLRYFTGGTDGISGVPYLSIGGLVFDTDLEYYYLVWSASLAILLMSQNIIRSRVGRALRAIEGSEWAARSVGINVGRFKTKVFVLTAVYASIAGSLFTHYLAFVSPQPFGFLFSVRLVVMAVVGGLSSIWGAVFGTTIVTFIGRALQELGELNVTLFGRLDIGELDVPIFGLILMLVVIFLPQGVTRGVRTLVDHVVSRFTGERR